MKGDLIRLSAAEPFPRQNTLPHDHFPDRFSHPRAGAVRTAEQLADELGMSVWSLKRCSKLYGKDSAVGGPVRGCDPPTAASLRSKTSRWLISNESCTEDTESRKILWPRSHKLGGASRFADDFIYLLLGVKLRNAPVRSTIWIRRI